MNGIYLSFFLREIKDQVIDRYVDSILVKDRLLQIVFKKIALYISLYPEVLATCIAHTQTEGYTPITAMNSLIKGFCVSHITQDAMKPVLRIGFQEGVFHDTEVREMIVYFYREAPNFVVRKGDKRRKLFSRVVEKKTRQTIWNLDTRKIANLFKGDRDSIEQRIVKEFEGIDQSLARELDPEHIEMIRQMMQGAPVRPRLISIEPLRISLFQDVYEKEYSCFNALMEDVIDRHQQMLIQKQQTEEKRKRVRNLKRRIARLQKKILTQEEIEQYRIIGELILANLSRIKKGDVRVTFLDPGTSSSIDIQLDPSKSPQVNAQKYFARYKKLKRGLLPLRDKIHSLECELERTEAGKQDIITVTSLKKKKTDQRATPFRIFTLDTGSHVYVGKNARSNEALTFSFANPHDYFFHVRGYQGSHTLLRTTGKKGEKPAKRDIIVAASIAAYFSKAKTQKRVPVSYTQRKYLKKNKKGKPGTVIMMREEVIFVDPAIPHS